jgi:nucleotide-binding universal stress UspA family protein
MKTSDMNIREEFTEQSETNGDRPEFCRNILAPIDLNQEAIVDLDAAIALAEHYNADLWLLGFSSEPPVAADTRGLCHFVWDRWDRRAQVRLWDWVLKARERHYQTFPLFVAGRYDAGEIIRTAERLMADMIVVPVEETSHRSGNAAAAQADELLRRSATPVFVAVSPKFTGEMDKKKCWK